MREANIRAFRSNNELANMLRGGAGVATEAAEDRSGPGEVWIQGERSRHVDQCRQ